MGRDDLVDFFELRDEHIAIHRRLESWARWVRIRPHGWQMQPMFRQFRSNWRQWHSPQVRSAVNIPEAVEMEKAVSLLPEKHREAIRWAYIWCDGPMATARRLGVSKQGLLDLIHQGRTMLRNRVCG